ncbi:hypothetical protein Tsubulata_040563 [Turnera subulata]|uniref:HTH myb-type domain-containing protein n=1 Tax=Turnera subulata TaxID=218843 RepID=A0A9Q0F2D3_9ROSI|nr:hypothetical protein Tsubulata_040563 [Turnera subulata]
MGLRRSGKSCRLRWMNNLSPSVKHGNFPEQEDDLIIRLHKLLGNRSYGINNLCWTPQECRDCCGQ